MEPIRVLYAASECVPFIKTGGLSDVAGSLPKYFDKDAFDVRVILPDYDCIPAYYRDQMEFVAEIPLIDRFPGGRAVIQKIELDSVTFYFAESYDAFRGSWPYSDVGSDIWKFAVFSNIVLSLALSDVFHPQILHLNDWQTALVPVYRDLAAHCFPELNGIRTIFTIHNMKFQGRYDLCDTAAKTRLPWSYFTMDTLEFYRDANLMKGALLFSDRITTVSDTYCDEITDVAYGEGLESLLRLRKNALSGILNGIDTISYDPSTDQALSVRLERQDAASWKKESKKALQRELGLREDENVILLSVVSRLTDQKGIDLIMSALDETMDDFTQLVVLGTGEPEYEAFFRRAQERYPGRIAACTYFSEAMSRRIYAASDVFLMPSRFEPCGLSQLIALRYGAVPVVRETGGLKDTVQPYNRFTGEGTGFSFRNFDRSEFLWAVNYAKTLYFTERDRFEEVRKRGMECDFSWNASAKKYEALYRDVVARGRC